MSREKAKELLVHWIFQAAGPSTEEAVAHGREEIASIVDEIVDAAIKETVTQIRQGKKP